MAVHAPRLHGVDALIGGAVAIAKHEMPEVTVDDVNARVAAIAAEIRGRFSSDSPHAILAHAHAVLFDEMEFTGVQGDHEPVDSYLPAVLERRRGLPITLGLVYKLVLERLGLSVHGLNTPTHFLVGVELDDSVMVVDAAARGRVMTMREVVQFVLTATQSKTLAGNNPLPVATTRDWLQRILRNLLRVFHNRQRPTEYAAMVELRNLLGS